MGRVNDLLKEAGSNDPARAARGAIALAEVMANEPILTERSRQYARQLIATGEAELAQQIRTWQQSQHN